MKADLIMKNIESLGEQYCQKYLSCWDADVLEGNWWEVLKFFLSHSFMRGRRDELSNEYYWFTIDCLRARYGIADDSLEEAYDRLVVDRGHFDKRMLLEFKRARKLLKKSSLKHPDFREHVGNRNPVIALMVTPKEVEVEWNRQKYRKEIHLGNDTDIMMLMDALSFISSDARQKNIYKYIKDSIINRGVSISYERLKSADFRGIADKIATFIIRDILMLNPHINIGENDYSMAFPIDTWVIKISGKLGFESGNIGEIKDYFIRRCRESGISPLKFAAGIWFLGFHSLDILIEDCLGKVAISGSH